MRADDGTPAASVDGRFEHPRVLAHEDDAVGRRPQIEPAEVAGGQMGLPSRLGPLIDPGATGRPVSPAVSAVVDTSSVSTPTARHSERRPAGFEG